MICFRRHRQAALLPVHLILRRQRSHSRSVVMRFSILSWGLSLPLCAYAWGASPSQAVLSSPSPTIPLSRLLLQPDRSRLERASRREWLLTLCHQGPPIKGPLLPT